MTVWLAVALACVAAYVIKLAGYLVPPAWLEGRRTAAVLTLLPVALLTALALVQTLGDGPRLAFDARLAGVGVAVVLLLARANFLLVVVAAAAVAAGLRALGWG